MVKVLVVDDSALMRKHLTYILEKAGFDTEIARNGEECLDKISTYKPDVITLDITMPVMDGITCLRLIMDRFPTPVVMVSSLTKNGAKATFDALELGAVDYVPKPSGSISVNMYESADMLIEKVQSASQRNRSLLLRTKILARSEQQSTDVLARANAQHSFSNKIPKKDIVLIGVSTGGPTCLQEILQNMPADFPVPIVIAQHMPARFTEVFAERLNKLSNLTILELTTPTAVEAGKVYIAKGEGDIKLFRRGSSLMVMPEAADGKYLWHPSVSKLVDSALEVVNPTKLVCVQLTGMGNDGADSMLNAFNKGATTIAESEETAVVYGMPRELVIKGGATIELPNHKIADAIIAAVVK